MKQWKSTLDVSDIWENEDTGGVTPVIGQRLIAKADEMLAEGLISEDDQYDLRGLGEEILNMEDPADREEFDNIWAQVYDWADIDKRLWINRWVA